MPVDTRLTYEDYCLLPDDGKRYEIIEGELSVTLVIIFHFSLDKPLVLGYAGRVGEYSRARCRPPVGDAKGRRRVLGARSAAG